MVLVSTLTPALTLVKTALLATFAFKQQPSQILAAYLKMEVTSVQLGFTARLPLLLQLLAHSVTTPTMKAMDMLTSASPVLRTSLESKLEPPLADLAREPPFQKSDLHLASVLV